MCDTSDFLSSIDFSMVIASANMQFTVQSVDKGKVPNSLAIIGCYQV